MAPERAENAKENSVLFQAVRHGVLAGKYQDALRLYETRINHNTATFVWLHLGQYSDVINCMAHFLLHFPDIPLGALDKREQRLVMNQLGCALMAAGRPRDAIRAFVKNVEIIHLSDHDGESAAMNLNNAAECMYFIGEPSLLMQFSAHAASAIEWTIKHCDSTDSPRTALQLAASLNAKLLYGIGLSHANLPAKSLQAIDIAEAWFRTCYKNADEFYFTQLGYWRSNLLANYLLCITSIKRSVVKRVERHLYSKYMSTDSRTLDDFGPFDQGSFFLSRAELRLSLLTSLAEGRIKQSDLTCTNGGNAFEFMARQVDSDLREAERRMSMNANRLWMGLIQTRQLQLARTNEMLGASADKDFDFEATFSDVMLLSQREGLRLLATDALLERAQRAHLLGDKLMVKHCLNQIDAFTFVDQVYPFKIQWPGVAPLPFEATVHRGTRFQHRHRERKLLAHQSI